MDRSLPVITSSVRKVSELYSACNNFICEKGKEIHPSVRKVEGIVLYLSSIYFRYFVMITPWNRAWPNKLEFPSPKDALCQVWLKLAE